MVCFYAFGNVGMDFPLNKKTTGRVHHRKHLFISGSKKQRKR